MDSALTPQAAQKGLPDLSPEAFDILRSAVNLARDQGIQRVATLRLRLNNLWPGRATDIEQAIAFWASSTARRHPGGIPR